MAIECLYGLSYVIKMGNKEVLEYVVPPLEGYWEVADDFKGGGAAITDRNNFVWTMLMRQPDFVMAEIFEMAKATLAKKNSLSKKPQPLMFQKHGSKQSPKVCAFSGKKSPSHFCRRHAGQISWLTNGKKQSNGKGSEGLTS